MINRLLVISLLAVMLFGTPLPNAVARERPPLVDYTPPAWTWWCDTAETRCVLLPQASALGEQTRFVVVAAGHRQAEYLTAFLGGGEVTWQGPVMLDADTPWDGQLVAGNDARGLCLVSPDLAWTVCAVSPESLWPHDAPVYNSLFKGGPDE